MNAFQYTAVSGNSIKRTALYLMKNAIPSLKLLLCMPSFESIHPFLDGNGRLGRILIALIAIKEDLVDVPVFFVSEELEKERARYYAMLNGVRGDNPDWYSWIKLFITACGRMADSLLSKLKTVEELASNGLKKCTLESEKNIWLYTFSDPLHNCGACCRELALAPGTARLKALSDVGLLYT